MKINRKILTSISLSSFLLIFSCDVSAGKTNDKNDGKTLKIRFTKASQNKRSFDDVSHLFGRKDNADLPEDHRDKKGRMKPKQSPLDLEEDRDFLVDEDLVDLANDDDNLPQTPMAPVTPEPEIHSESSTASTALIQLSDFERKILELESFPEALKLLNEVHTDMMRGGFISQDGQIKRKRYQLLMDLPWKKKDRSDVDLTIAKAILDGDHYGLEKVKKRILQHLAVQKRKKESIGTVLCLVGPPGVGKTTLAASIAKAMGRKFVKEALGGVHDEAAIRGYLPSYQAAGPGIILKAMTKTDVINPVILLDEIDKMGQNSHNGSPGDALLEVLDPSQNKTFKDHYLDIAYDLSQVMFIASANSLDTIPAPLLDRMEVIQLSSYTPLEKFEIAKRHLMPVVFRDTGLHEGELTLTDAAVKSLINDYTSEAGVRDLARVIGAIGRGVVMFNSTHELQNFVIEPDMLTDYLDQPSVRKEKPLDYHMVGHTQGLSVSASGGHMLPVEVKVVTGRGNIIRTGKMGDVMKESADAAMTVVRDRMIDYGVDPKNIKRKDFHVHFYAAAIPKDGPSAGLAMATTIMSAITGRPVNRLVCMTGEISLHGKALPIGGLKEKLIAAHRAGMEITIIPEGNIENLVDVPDEVRQELEILAVKDISEVLEIALM